MDNGTEKNLLIDCQECFIVRIVEADWHISIHSRKTERPMTVIRYSVVVGITINIIHVPVIISRQKQKLEILLQKRDMKRPWLRDVKRIMLRKMNRVPRMNGILLRYSSCKIEEKKRELMQYSILIYFISEKGLGNCF